MTCSDRSKVLVLTTRYDLDWTNIMDHLNLVIVKKNKITSTIVPCHDIVDYGIYIDALNYVHSKSENGICLRPLLTEL